VAAVSGIFAFPGALAEHPDHPVAAVLRDHAGVRDHITSGSWWAAMNVSMTGSIALVPALFP
jgi:hypothetical protein